MVYSSWVRTMRKKRIRINKARIAIYAVIVALIVYFGASAMKIVKLNSERDELYAYNEELQHEKESLQLKLENISSPDYIESQARKDLKLVKPNELIFVFPEEDYENDEETKDAKEAEDADNAKDKD